MKTISIIFVLLVFALLLHCSKEDNPVSPEIHTFSFPLAVGNKWVYESKFYLSNVRIIDPNYTVMDTIKRDIMVEVVKYDTIPGCNKAYFLKYIEDDNYIGHRLLINEENGLHLLGYFGGLGISLPKTNLSNYHSSLFFNPIYQPLCISLLDSFQILNPPQLILKYPLKIGDQWSLDENMDKKIIETTEIKLQAGNFECYKIKWIDKGINDYEFYDFLSSKGLVKRIYISKNQALTGETSSDALAYADFVNEITLKSYILK